jgi:hypothetical protein
MNIASIRCSYFSTVNTLAKKWNNVMQDKGKFNLIDEDLHGSGGSQFQWRIVNSKKQPSFE